MNHNRSPAAIPIEGSCQSRASGVNSHPPAATITPDVGSHDKPGGLDRKSLVSPFVKNAEQTKTILVTTLTNSVLMSVVRLIVHLLRQSEPPTSVT
jgi:hypothetical protein